MRLRIIYFLLFTCCTLLSCRKIVEGVELKAVRVQLKYPEVSAYGVKEGVAVTFRSSTTVIKAYTDAQGKAVALLPVGVYNVTAADSRSAGLYKVIFNGLNTGVVVHSEWNEDHLVDIDLAESKASQVIIKELFIGGTPRDDGSGYFAFDKYAILYNNSEAPADISKLCLAMVGPYNANASNNYYDVNNKLVYEAEEWVPAVQAFWYFPNSLILQPGQQLVVAITGAINHTTTYSRSVNLANAGYYCMYDIINFPNASYYPTPSALIPTSQYLKAQKYGTGNAWTISVNSPGFFIFNLEKTTPAAFAADPANVHTVTGLVARKVPFDWIVDAVEVFLLNNSNNKKRFPAAIDAGFVNHINELGYSVYRNVDKEATEAISTNAGKLVYNYNLGTTAAGGSTDPSGINAEASIKNGAHIIYSDKNNTTTDFHLRAKASLRAN